MKYYKQESGGVIRLFVVDGEKETISKLTWTDEDIIRYRWNYGFENQAEVEEYEEISEAAYIEFAEAAHDASRIGTHPTRPPGS